MKNNFFDFGRIIRALSFSGKGLFYVLKTEAAFAQDLLLFAVGTMIAFCFNFDAILRILMIFSLFLVILMELINTAIEVIIDRISLKKNPLSGHAKDIGSALVLLAILNVVFIWGYAVFTFLKN